MGKEVNNLSCIVYHILLKAFKSSDEYKNQFIVLVDSTVKIKRKLNLNEIKNLLNKSLPLAEVFPEIHSLMNALFSHKGKILIQKLKSQSVSRK